MYIDTHTHFDIILENKNISPDDLFFEMNKNKVTSAVQISIDAKNLEWSYNFSKKYKKNGILFSMGIHPSSWADGKNLDYLSGFIKKIMESDDADLLLGIGECGLDFYRMRQKKEMQINSFELQISEAKKWDIPLIIHSRDAMDETIGILKNQNISKGIMHCFPGDRKAAKKVLDMGFHLSFAGNVTYNKAIELHDSASYIPLERLLIETDAPFLSPVPKRGKKNRPYYIINTYKFIAELREDPLEKIIRAVAENFKNLRKNSLNL